MARHNGPRVTRAGVRKAVDCIHRYAATDGAIYQGASDCKHGIEDDVMKAQEEEGTPVIVCREINGEEYIATDTYSAIQQWMDSMMGVTKEDRARRARENRPIVIDYFHQLDTYTGAENREIVRVNCDDGILWWKKPRGYYQLRGERWHYLGEFFKGPVK